MGAVGGVDLGLVAARLVAARRAHLGSIEMGRACARASRVERRVVVEHDERVPGGGAGCPGSSQARTPDYLRCAARRTRESRSASAARYSRVPSVVPVVDHNDLDVDVVGVEENALHSQPREGEAVRRDDRQPRRRACAGPSLIAARVRDRAS